MTEIDFAAKGPRRPFWLIYLALFVLALGWSGYWLWTANRVQAEIAAWAAQEAEQGREFRWDTLEVGGYPFRIVVDATGWAAAEPGAPVPWAVSGTTMQAVAQAWNLSHVQVGVQGPTTIGLTRPDGTTREWVAAATGARASIVVEPDRDLPRITANITQLSITDNARTAPWTVERAQLALRNLPQEADGPRAPGGAETIVQLDGFAPVPLPAALGDTVEVFQLSGRITGPVPRRLDPAALWAWRTAGGTLEIDRLWFDWGEVELDLNGTFAIDIEGRPQGAATAALTDPDTLIAAFQEAGQIGRGPADLLRLAANALSIRTAGGEQVIEAPLAMQDGVFRVGPVPVGNLPRIVHPPQ